MLDQEARIHRRSDSARSGPFHDAGDVEASQAPKERCRLEQYVQAFASRELNLDRETVIVDYHAYFRRGVELDASDQVEIDGRIYDVVGQPARDTRPLRGNHHVEAQLHYVSGG